MSPTKQAADFGPAQVDELFSNLKRFRHLALAVSGGSDSTALMLLAARWKGPVKFSVLTVDHGLRARCAARRERSFSAPAHVAKPSR